MTTTEKSMTMEQRVAEIYVMIVGINERAKADRESISAMQKDIVELKQQQQEQQQQQEEGTKKS